VKPVTTIYSSPELKRHRTNPDAGLPVTVSGLLQQFCALKGVNTQEVDGVFLGNIRDTSFVLVNICGKPTRFAVNRSQVHEKGTGCNVGHGTKVMNLTGEGPVDIPPP